MDRIYSPKSISSSGLKPLFISTNRQQNRDNLLQQSFKSVFKFPFATVAFHFWKATVHSSSHYFIIFNWLYIKLFFFFLLHLPDFFLSLPFFLLSLLFSLIFSSPLSPLLCWRSGLAWWLTVSQSRLGVCAANLGLGWWVCATDLGLDPRAQELHDSPTPVETQNHLHRDPLRLGLCRGSPTRGLVHGAMGGGHMWRRRRVWNVWWWTLCGVAVLLFIFVLSKGVQIEFRPLIDKVKKISGFFFFLIL